MQMQVMMLMMSQTCRIKCKMHTQVLHVAVLRRRYELAEALLEAGFQQK